MNYNKRIPSLAKIKDVPRGVPFKYSTDPRACVYLRVDPHLLENLFGKRLERGRVFTVDLTDGEVSFCDEETEVYVLFQAEITY